MALLGGAFESTSSTQTTTTTQNAGFSETGGSAISLNLTGGGKRSTVSPTVNVLDGGAVKLGFDTANNAISASRYGLDNALDFATDVTSDFTNATLEVLKSALDSSHDAYADALHVTSDAFGSVQELAKQTSATESDRITKLATYAFLAIAALVILPKVFTK